MIKVLVVDDSKSNVSTITRALENSNLDYMVIEDASLTLDIAKVYMPDVILLDLFMPNSDGCGIIHAIRTDPITALIEVVQITANNNINDLLISVRLNVADYLIKPIKIETLLEKIKTISVCKNLRELTTSIKSSAEIMIDRYQQ